MRVRGHSAVVGIALVALAELFSIAPVRGQNDDFQPRRGGRLRPRLEAELAAPAIAQAEPPVQAVRAAPSISTRELKTRFQRGRELLADGNYAEGTRLLQSILENDEDAFFYPDNARHAGERSLKFEVQVLLGEMPAEGRENYEKQYGPIARRLLAEAIRNNDADQLGGVTRRYFHTQAGYEAAYRLAASHLDHERPLTAALCYELLRQMSAADDQYEPMLSLKTAVSWLRAGRDARAAEVLLELKRKYPREAVTLGGRDVALFDESAKALAWLTAVAGPRPADGATGPEQWTMVRGDVRRNASSSGGSPYLNRGWRSSTLDGTTTSPAGDAAVGRALGDRRSSGQGGAEDAAAPAIPMFQPLIVGGLVVVRSFGDVRAYDTAAGQLVWATSEKDQTLLETIRTGATGAPPQAAAPLAVLLAQRSLADSTFGTLSSDGEFVFAVEDLGLGYVISPSPRSQPVREYNRLVAYDARTGKAVWEAGGPRVDATDELAGMFFLGAPLVLDRRLYCLGETGSEVRLVVLDPRTGRRDWSQSLTDGATALGVDMFRRQSGLTPSYEGGILVCPTGSDQVVAMDLTRRSLSWRYRFRAAAEQMDPRRAQQVFIQQQQMAARGQVLATVDQNRWLDSLAIISDARVILTPRDSNEITCLNLMDGTLAWRKPRGEGLFVAGVHDSRVIIVGKAYVQAMKLADGEPAWPGTAVLPAPSGRGFTAQGYYHLPLSTAEVATIDLNDGRIVSRSKSLGDRVPGNLVGVRGTIVSQGLDFVEGYRQLDTLEAEIAAAIEKNSDDANALALRGEIYLQRGKLREAYVDLRRALALKSDDDAVRQLLLGSLLEGLRVDFPTYRDLRGDIAGLLLDAEQRSTFLWLEANGLLRAGEPLAAFEALLHFAEPGVDDDEMERIDGTLMVRRDRMVRSRVAELYSAAETGRRAAMDKLLAAAGDAAAKRDDPAALRRFLDYFGDRQRRDDLERRVAQEPSAGEWLTEEFRLRSLQSSETRETAAAATARLVALLLAAERPRDAVPFIRRLESDWPEIACLDDKTGRELAHDWLKRPGVEREIAPPPVWPVGRVDADRQILAGNAAASRAFVVPIDGRRGPFFGETTLEVSARWQDFLARDALGNQLWKVTLDAPVQANNILFNRAFVRDHLALILVGTQIVAVDTLGTADEPGARVLWRTGLTDLPTGLVVPRGMIRGGRRGFNTFGDQIGTVGPVAREHLTVIKGRRLVALDPLTGKPLWIREGMTPGSELLGDDELVFVVPPEGNDAIVYRGLDGTLLGTRTLPPSGTRLETIGRRVVSWRKTEKGFLLSLFDAWSGVDIWTREYEGDAQAAVVDVEEVAVLESSGRFTIMNIADAVPRLESKVDPIAPIEQILVLRSPEQYILLVKEPLPNDNLQWTQVPLQSVQVHGPVHAFDRATGKKQWTTRIELHGIDPSQPMRLPVLTFVCQSLERRRDAKGNPVPGVDSQFGLLCLDKRNGRIVYNDKRPEEPLYYVDFAADPEQHQLDLKLFRSVLRLTFTDKPVEK